MRMAVASTRSMQEQELLDAACGGDEDAFRRIVEDHRAELHAHCYRMLGSLHDAEDALQDTFLRAWRALPGFGGRSSLRTWLYRIATNACLDAIARRPKRVLPIDYGPPTASQLEPGAPLVESVWVEPYPDRDARPLGRLRLAGRSLRAARGSGARLHRGVAAPACDTARGTGSARGARLLGARGIGAARDDRRVGEQRPATRPQDSRRSTSRAEPAGDATLARRRADP